MSVNVATVVLLDSAVPSVAALSFVALRLRGDRLNGLRLSLGLAAVALVVAVLWQ